jgi:nitroreductase
VNEVLHVIARRRSVRQFKREQIADGELQSIIQAGLQAPTAHNDQSCYFVVIQDKALIDAMSEGSKAEMRKSPLSWIADLGRARTFNIYYGAPTVIIVATRKDAVSPVADACAAIENMLIAAESLNIGACWIGFSRYYFIDSSRYNDLRIPEGYEVQYAVALGPKPAGLTLHAPGRKRERYFHVIKP